MSDVTTPWVLAHGVGSRGDLPLPLWQFTWAATAALVISFVALGALWTEPKLSRAAEGRPVSWLTGAVSFAAPVARTASFVLFVLVLLAGFFGTDDPSNNISPWAIYVVLWVVLQMLVCIIGDVWRVLSPFDTMAIGIDRLRTAPTSPAPSWSYWWAPVGAALFIFMELIHPTGNSPLYLSTGVAIYTVVTMSAVWRWGRGWLSEGETISLHYGLLASMAPLHRDGRGKVHVRTPLSGLASLEMTPVGTATLLVVLGGVTFDGLGDSPLWRDVVGTHTGWTDVAVRGLGFLNVTFILAALYLASVRSMATITNGEPRRLANLFAPSLVPIVFGYTLAHYLQLALDETQTFIFQLSDPFGQGWNVFGGADGRINYDLVDPAVLSWIQALGVVIGHIAGVLVAHDRSVAEFEHRDAMRSQYVMLFVMVLYSVLGLWLLLNA